jgi:hypothetical protein
MSGMNKKKQVKSTKRVADQGEGISRCLISSTNTGKTLVVRKNSTLENCFFLKITVMSKQTEIKIFDDKQVRTFWDREQEKWFIAIVDVIAVLTESIDPNAYWRKLKQRLKVEENETVTNCHSLKMLATDGKMRMTDVAVSG